MTAPMPETMSPREKVAVFETCPGCGADEPRSRCLGCRHDFAPINCQASIDSSPDAALASSGDQLSGNPRQLKSGDHAELARLADDLRKFEHHAVGSLKIGMDEVRRIIAACDAHATLIAEVAALREDLNRKHEACQIAQDQAMENGSRAREAERKLAEAVGLLGEARGDLVATAEADTPEWSRRVYESSRADYEQDMDLPNRIGAFIASLSSKEAERG